MSAEQEKLKPCPFCGKLPKREPRMDVNIYQHQCQPVSGRQEPVGCLIPLRFHYEAWQNAYCWRENEALRDAIEKYIREKENVVPDHTMIRHTFKRLKEALNAKGKA